MIKTTIKIDGMMCPMCEAHVTETIRKAYPEAKVTSSHKKGESIVLAPIYLNEKILKKAIGDTGYTFISMSSEEAPDEKSFLQKLFHRGEDADW
ncbi:MAG: hypothetical protein LUC43_00610 [Burkholderiales bacterium]|nr:hypothetical protein [Burkholderiales bacterium]